MPSSYNLISKSASHLQLFVKLPEISASHLQLFFKLPETSASNLQLFVKLPETSAPIMQSLEEEQSTLLGLASPLGCFGPSPR
ncbi:hypothetical protein Pyn_39401 [Prunus yedoensis var. nudiflora]|uniref:Uncharacterized protein n=1 Tax=Prunus yedoensis var. nudiflora TaxID=2094558 RepID=A0A314ZEV4_PRUYE|nr:hypothetical protein Pyn_39401 [Prunus yedoensis var. nudiflora]